MSKTLQRIPHPEIFFGIVAAIGTNIEKCIEILEQKIRAFEYRTVHIRVTNTFEKLSPKTSLPVTLTPAPLDKRYETYIAFGDAIRTKFDDDSFFASVAFAQVIEQRRAIFKSASDVPESCAYIVRQFKRREEIELLRSVYGRLFFQISIYSKRASRVDNLSSSIADSGNYALELAKEN